MATHDNVREVWLAGYEASGFDNRKGYPFGADKSFEDNEDSFAIRNARQEIADLKAKLETAEAEANTNAYQRDKAKDERNRAERRADAAEKRNAESEAREVELVGALQRGIDARVELVCGMHVSHEQKMEAVAADRDVIAMRQALTNTDNSIMDALLAAKALKADWDRIISERGDCVDPDAECPLQDSHKQWFQEAARQLEAALAKLSPAIRATLEKS